MKKNVLILSALCFAAMTLVFSGCKKETNDPQEPAKVQTYQMSIQASKGANDNQANGPRRVIELGDGEETLTATWRTGDRVYVYNVTTGQELSGYLEAADNLANTQLNGSLSGTVSVGNELLLKYQPNPSYTDQEGTLEYISGHCDYATATVTVATVNGGLITTTTSATFDNQQAIVKFTLKDGNGSTLSPTALTINNGADIATLAIPAETYTTNGAGVLYVAIPATSADLTLTATAADGTYTKAVTSENATLANGQYYRIALSMTKQTAPATVPEGGINGEFNLCDKKIWFSKGNLQYNASSNTWRFAEHQYDIAGAANASISASYNGWIDLFGWATSGINTPAENTYYQPWNTDNTNANYGSGITSKADWADAHANYDWGENAISNGGNTPNSGWRTLTAAEWYCLVYDRAGATVNSVSRIRHAWATIDTHRGLILFPDDGTFTADEFTEIPSTKSGFNDMDYKTTTCTLEQWAALEAKGCVFLPAAGQRSGTTVDERTEINSKGYYWSSTAENNTNAYYGFAFKSSEFTTSLESTSRRYGLSVRLVKDVD
ncbi:MAG: hypothetical protein J6M55_06075 [Paludibacteraceae bacterium]|nr:hypothetical protein [Paludibacteraceae bacterium]